MRAGVEAAASDAQRAAITADLGRRLVQPHAVPESCGARGGGEPRGPAAEHVQ
jgi:hypothetical protein